MPAQHASCHARLYPLARLPCPLLPPSPPPSPTTPPGALPLPQYHPGLATARQQLRRRLAQARRLQQLGPAGGRAGGDGTIIDVMPPPHTLRPPDLMEEGLGAGEHHHGAVGGGWVGEGLIRGRGAGAGARAVAVVGVLGVRGTPGHRTGHYHLGAIRVRPRASMVNGTTPVAGNGQWVALSRALRLIC